MSSGSRGIETAALMIVSLVIGAGGGFFFAKANVRAEKAEGANTSILEAVQRAEKVADRLAADAKTVSTSYAQFNSASKRISENVETIKALDACYIPDDTQRMRADQRRALQAAQAQSARRD